MKVKKVVVSTVDTRKFVDSLLYLGGLGGKLTENCVAIKGMFLRAEVEVSADAIVEQTPEMRLAAGLEYEAVEEAPVETKVEEPKKARGRKPKADKEEQESTPEE